MKCAVLAVLALAPMVVAAGRGRAAATPVSKVIDLLNAMVEKGKSEKHEEALQFKAYEKFCKDTSAAKTWAIGEANDKIEMLTADIQGYEADAEKAGKKVAQDDADISTWSGNLKAATEVRETEKADYQVAFADYGESITALEEGLATLAKENKKTAQASAALAQVAASNLIPEAQKKVIYAFLESDPDENIAVSLGAPEGAAYEFQAQGIVDMLEKLKEKFEDERSDLEKSEMNAGNAYEMLALDLKNQISHATEDRAEQSERKAEAMQNAAEAKSDLQDTTNTRDDDTKYLSDLTATCALKADAFAERQKLRAEEIAAVEKAIEILGSGAVAGASEKHLPALLQKKGVALAQLRAVAQSPTQLRVAAFLKEQAIRLKSRVLSTLAVRVTADPFKKVKQMIKDMIVKLMEEANEEAEHKGFCDTELSTNEQTRKQKTES